MSDYGMTDQGFVAKTLAEIQTDISARLSAITNASGERPFLNMTDDSILGQTVGIFSEALADCWAEAEKAAAQFDPLRNSGAGQSGTVQLNAIVRKAGVASRVEVVLSGRQGALIPAGSLIADRDAATVFSTDDAAVIPTSGEVLATATCAEYGPVDPEIGSIFVIQTPRDGWLSVRNTATILVGALEETDEELRLRQQRSTAETSYRQIESIWADLQNIEGVSFVRVYQNRGLVADGRGLPGKSISAVIEGGEDRDIAESIFKRAPVGLDTVGDTSVVLYDAQGVDYPIRFQRPETVPIYIDLKIRVLDSTEYPAGGDDRIRAAIVAYAQYGGAGNEDGFPPGAGIVRTRLFTPINSVPGHEIVSLEIGTSADALSESNIAIGWDQVGRFASERISVGIVT